MSTPVYQVEFLQNTKIGTLIVSSALQDPDQDNAYVLEGTRWKFRTPILRGPTVSVSLEVAIEDDDAGLTYDEVPADYSGSHDCCCYRY